MITAPLYIRRSEFLDQYGISNRLAASWQARRLIPFVKIGRKTTLFKVADIERFLQAHTIKTKRLAQGEVAQ